MKLTEAIRQYQIALEHERALRLELDGVISAEDVIADAAAATEEAKQKMDALWLERQIA